MVNSGNIISATWVGAQPDPFFVSYWLRPDTLGSNQFIYDAAGWGSFEQDGETAGGLYIGTDLANRITPSDTGSNFLVNGELTFVCFGYSGGVGTLYKSGIQAVQKSGMVTPESWSEIKIDLRDTDATIFDFRIAQRDPSPGEVYAMYEPGTRWDLYHELGRKSYFFVSGAAGISDHRFPQRFFG